MKNFLNSLTNFGAQSHLGIDIGTASVKLVEIESSKGKISLKNYGILETGGHLDQINDAIQTSSLEILDSETAEVIKTLIDQVGPQTKDVAISLPAFSAFTSLLQIPDIPDKETSQAMEYQAKSLVPMPLSKVRLDWFRVGRGTSSSGAKVQSIFLVAVPSDLITKYQNIVKKLGFNLKVMELETVSSARVLTSGDPTLTLIIDMGARSTAISIAQNGYLYHSAQADFAGASLTQAVAQGLGINKQRAEELKKQKGLLGQGGEYQVSTLMLPYLDVIISEAKRVKESYEKSNAVTVGRVILSGGGANLLGVEKYISEELQLPAVKADPFGAKVSYPQSMSPIIKEVGPHLTVALGLGIKGFSK